MRKVLLTVLSLMMVLSIACVAACGKKDETTSPRITVTPSTMEITQGDEISLLYGVTVEDDYDADLKATVTDNGGFDKNVVNTYTITYSATNSKGKTGTATRTITVVAPLANIVVEAQTANDTAWNDTVFMSFAHERYIEVSADTEYTTADSGVYKNTSTGDITLNFAGSHGEAAILNAAGVVIEGRDGANGRLVNKANPVRASGGSLTPANFAKDLVVPAGGFAIVVQTGCFGDTFDTDGRAFMAKNVIHQYGAAVKIYWYGETELMTVYADQAPVVLTATKVGVFKDTTEDVDALILQGITYVDDNGTFAAADDVKTGLTVEIKTKPENLDIATVGNYTYVLKITDGKGNVTEFERVLEVRNNEPDEATMAIDGMQWFTLNPEKVGVNVAGSTSFEVIVYNKYYTGTYFVNNYGSYFIVNKDGVIREEYNAAANKRYELASDNTVTQTASTTENPLNTNVLSHASALAEGEYLVLVVNGAGTDLRSTYHTYVNAKADHTVGLTCKFWFIDVLPTINVTKADNSKVSFSAASLPIYVNANAGSDGNASKAAFLVYSHGYTGELKCNGYGIAYIINSDGKVAAIYDGANGNYWSDATGKVAAGAYFTSGTYAADALADLTEGQTLIIFPNNGANAAGSPRAVGLSLRPLGEGQKCSDIVFSFAAFTAELPAAE